MSQSKVPVMAVHELTSSQMADFFAVLSEKAKSRTRDGRPYYVCRFRDVKRVVSCVIWGDGPWYAACESDWVEGQAYRLSGMYNEHAKFGPQVELYNIRYATDADRRDGYDPALLVEASRFAPGDLFAELLTLAESEIHDEGLRRLTLHLLNTHEAALKVLPASENKFYPFRGGWLEHVVSVTRNCIFLADRYIEHYLDLEPPLNRDLIVAGAMLHDIGRVLELELGPPLSEETMDLSLPRPTIPGRLAGHLLLGRDMVRDAAREVGDVHPELVELLEHIVLTHLSIPEWGSPRLPLIPECIIIHHADDLDAKMEMYARCLNNDMSPGPFTARDPMLGKPLLKQRSV